MKTHTVALVGNGNLEVASNGRLTLKSINEKSTSIYDIDGLKMDMEDYSIYPYTLAKNGIFEFIKIPHEK
jgi:hypothetical protein|nr:hypothetical protein [uncultured Flavobacterium sp.]